MRNDPYMEFNASIDLQAAADSTAKKPPRFSMTAYTGGIIQPGGWSDTVIDLAGAAVGKVPILVGHGESIDDLCGEGVATIRNGTIVVEGTLTDATPAGQKVLAIARGGIALQASVGFATTKRERVAAGDKIRVNNQTLTAGPSGLTVVRAGMLREVSIVSVGADPNTSVSISAKRGNSMNEENNVNTTIDPTAADIRAAAVAETQRIAAIRAQCAGRHADIEAKAIADGWTDAQTGLEILRASRPTAPAIHTGGPTAEPAKMLEAAMLIHLGCERIGEKHLGEHAMESGRRLRARHVLDVLEHGLRLEGREVPATRDGVIKAAFTTMSLPGILGNAANKVLLDAYQAFPSAARQVARKLTAADFKTATGYRLTGDTRLLHVPRSGELTHGKLTESSFTYKVGTYGRMFGLTRQDVIDDDLGALGEIPRMIGRGAALAVEVAFFDLVLANAGNFFGTGNHNLVSGGPELSSAGLAAATLLFRKQTDADGVLVNIEPRFLLAPPELEITANELMTAITMNLSGGSDLTSLPSTNYWASKYKPVVSPYLSDSSLTGNSAAAWYLLADPNDVAAFGIAYLDGNEMPVVEEAPQAPNVLGFNWRGYLDFGVCQIDPRGAVKSDGE